MTTDELAPIALFAYNRPEHTLKTLESLAGNDLASESILYIFVDAARDGSSKSDVEANTQVKELVAKRRWCKQCHVITRERNYGLADNIVKGVTQVISHHGRVIVLEDDIVTSKGFLMYMNSALSLYANCDRVMHISGYMFPVKGKLPETFFYRQASCWGWATWERAWKYFEPDPIILRRRLAQTGKLRDADIDGTGQFLQQLDRNISGAIKTWAVKWQFSVQLADGLCLHPGQSLVRNIGLDGTGENSGMSSLFDVKPVEHVSVKRIPITDYGPVYQLLRKFYNPAPGWKQLAARASKRLPTSVRAFVRQLVDAQYRAEISEIRRLKSMPRFKRTRSKLLGLTIELADAASFLHAKNEIFRQEIYRFRTNNKRPFIIDCGANIGLSVIYFKSRYPNAEVVAFEPDKEIFSILTRNIRTFGLTDVTPINKGLWDADSRLRFFSEGADAGRIATKEDEGTLIDIETTRLRPYLNRRVDFLKIDIEGAELRVIKDCEDLLGNVDRLFVEYHSFLDEEQNLDELLSILKNAGFRYVMQQHGVLSPQPFLKVDHLGGMDILLNISAYRG